MDRLRNINSKELFDLLSLPDGDFTDWLCDAGLLYREKICPSCGNNMNFKYKKDRTYPNWRNTTKHVQALIKNDLGVVTEDQYVLNVRGGTGGNGLARYNGIGGNGGNVYFVATPGMAFTDIRKQFRDSWSIRASSGTSSQKTKLVGEHAKDTVVQMPVGVDVVNGSNNFLLARCRKSFEKYLIAEGGDGGGPTNGFRGQKGDHVNITVHLKLRPNVGFVGFPNAGKSTLLSAFVPRKSVKIAPYPFTTVNPQIAFWANSTEDDEHFSLSLADLPGIIEGASLNRGRGHKFLKHLEYSEILCFVVDSCGFQLKNSLEEPFRTPLETVAILNKELENFDKNLVYKPSILLLNKMDVFKDTQDIDNVVDNLRKPDWHLSVNIPHRPNNPIRFEHVIPISAKSGKIDQVKRILIRLHKELHPRFADPLDNNVITKKML